MGSLALESENILFSCRAFCEKGAENDFPGFYRNIFKPEAVFSGYYRF